MTTFILTMVVAVGVTVALIVGVDAALEWFERRRYGDCSPMNHCPECAEAVDAACRQERGL
jgi:hypothetical protein